MENVSVNKINSIGKAASIIAKIIRGVLLAAAIVLLVVLLFLGNIAQEPFVASLSGSADIIVNTADPAFTTGLISDFKTDASETKLTINDCDYDFVSAEQQGDQLLLKFAYEQQELTIANFRLMLWGMLLAFAASAALMYFVVPLCRELQHCSSPFEKGIADAMKRLCIALVPWFILKSAGESITEGALKGNINIVLGIDLGAVMVILLLVVLMYVFKHGAQLQQQADETL